MGSFSHSGLSPYNDANNAAIIQFLLDCCIDKNILVVGDFNLPFLRWDESGDIAEGYITPLDRSFYESFLMAGLSQIVTQPTFASSGNILDLILVSNSEMVGDYYVLPPLPRCHHSPVLVDLYLPSISTSSTVIPARLWSKGNYSAISRELKGLDWNLCSRVCWLRNVMRYFLMLLIVWLSYSYQKNQKTIILAGSLGILKHFLGLHVVSRTSL